MNITTLVRCRGFLGLALVVLLWGCGGGGGGGGGGSTGGGSTGNGSTFQFSPTTIAFTAPDVSSPAPASQKVTFTATGGTVIFGRPTLSGEQIVSVTQNFISTNTVEVVLDPIVPSSVGPGLHSATLGIVVCDDLNCNVQSAGSPHNISVTYRVAGFSASPNFLIFSAVEGDTPPTQGMNLAHSDGSSAWTSTIDYLSGAPGWLQLSPPSGASLPVAVSARAQPMIAGNYRARLQATAGASNGYFAVEYDVSKALNPSPAELNFRLSATPSAADLVRALGITSRATSRPALTWQASVDVPWLTLSASAGVTGGAIDVLLNPAQTAGMADGIHTATLTLTSSTAMVSTVTVPVKLTVERTPVARVAPYLARAGRSNPVIIRGRGFNSVATPGVKFGTSSATTFTIISDTEIRATPPVLPVGTYPVVLTSAGTGLASSAVLVARDAVSSQLRTAALRPNDQFLYDHERRNAVLMSGPFVFLNRFDGAAWNELAVASAYLFKAAASTFDGRRILLTTTDNRVVELDATDLSIKFVTPPQTQLQFPRVLAAPFPANDGKVVLVGHDQFGAEVMVYDQADGTVTARPTAFPLPKFQEGLVIADGSRVLLRFETPGTGANVRIYDAGTGVLSDPVARVLNPLAGASRDGSRIVTRFGDVYDRNLQLLGRLPQTQDGFTLTQCLVSPDGTRAYGVYFLQDDERIYTFDLTVPPAPTFNPAPGFLAHAGRNSGWQVSHDGTALLVMLGSELIVYPAQP